VRFQGIVIVNEENRSEGMASRARMVHTLWNWSNDLSQALVPAKLVCGCALHSVNYRDLLTVERCRAPHSRRGGPFSKKPPHLWIRRSSFERRRDLNPPDSCAAQRTLWRGQCGNAGPETTASDCRN
jgi:hypothetical protein